MMGRKTLYGTLVGIFSAMALAGLVRPVDDTGNDEKFSGFHTASKDKKEQINALDKVYARMEKPLERLRDMERQVDLAPEAIRRFRNGDEPLSRLDILTERGHVLEEVDALSRRADRLKKRQSSEDPIPPSCATMQQLAGSLSVDLVQHMMTIVNFRLLDDAWAKHALAEDNFSALDMHFSNASMNVSQKLAQIRLDKLSSDIDAFEAAVEQTRPAFTAVVRQLDIETMEINGRTIQLRTLLPQCDYQLSRFGL